MSLKALPPRQAKGQRPSQALLRANEAHRNLSARNQRITNLGDIVVPTRTVRRGKFDDGARTKIETGNTNVRFAPGMEEIAKGLVAQQKDLKIILKAVTGKGAQDWIQANDKKGYHVQEVDITGDGMKDVIVTNQKGEIMMINGKKLVPTKHGERVLSATVNRGRKPGERITKRDLRRRANTLALDDNGNPVFADDFPDELLPYVNSMKRNKALTPANVFNDLIFTPLAELVYENLATDDIINEHKVNPLSKARAFREASAMLFDHIVTKNVLMQTFELEETDAEGFITSTHSLDKKKLSNYKRRVLFRKSALHLVTNILDRFNEFRDEIMSILSQILSNSIFNHRDSNPASQERKRNVRNKMVQGMENRRAAMNDEIVWLPGEDNYVERHDDSGLMGRTFTSTLGEPRRVSRPKRIETIHEDDDISSPEHVPNIDDF